MEKKIAVLIPCYNEELTVGSVVKKFKKELPKAEIYVYDNNSNDTTAQKAQEAGAIVRFVPKQGKGNVVRQMFMEVEAEYYVMIDGDDTYPVEAVHQLLSPVMKEKADMSLGDRHSNGSYEAENTRPFHNFGNNLVKNLINRLYKENLKDIMSGYRVFSRDFVKHFPIHSEGFEIETEMSMHALDKGFGIVEVPIDYVERCEGSESKLNTFSDGIRILKTIFWLFKNYRPLAFFTTFSALFFFLALVVGMPVIVEFFQTNYITKLPSAVLAVGLMLISIISLFAGFILDTVVRQHRELYQLSRLQKRF